jgi:DNA-binding Lrp family transcriptional regulator
VNFTDRETSVLNRIQGDIPIVKTPFALLASELKQSESEVISIIARMRERGVIRNISGIFNAESLGYQISLVTFEVPVKYIDRAAEIINSHPGVSHNYLRDHRFNMWFTLAVSPENSFEKTVSILKRGSQARDSLILKKEMLLKIGLMLPVGNKPPSKKTENITEVKHRIADARYLSDEERESIRLLQLDLPLEKRPFRSLIEKNDSILNEERLIKLGQSLKEEGIMRRYSAVLRHRDAGFIANVMTVWKPDDSADMGRIAEIFIREPSISHLYIRTVYPGKWEYPLFAMIHAKSSKIMQRTVERLARESGIYNYEVLTTLREFKKKRVSFFSSDFHTWQQQYYLPEKTVQK